MYDFERKLFKCFPGSIINDNEEFIAHRESNTYFILNCCACERDVQAKLLICFSRAAFKTVYGTDDAKSEALHDFISRGVNRYLGTDFPAADWEDIYVKLGNGCNRDLCNRLINSGFDMTLLRGEK